MKIDENIKPLYVYKQPMTLHEYEVQNIRYEYIFWKMRLQFIFIYLLGGAAFLRAFYKLTVENVWLTGKGVFTVAALVGIIITGIIVPKNIYHKKLKKCGSEELFTYVIELYKDYAIEYTPVSTRKVCYSSLVAVKKLKAGIGFEFAVLDDLRPIFCGPKKTFFCFLYNRNMPLEIQGEIFYLLNQKVRRRSRGVWF